MTMKRAPANISKNKRPTAKLIVSTASRSKKLEAFTQKLTFNPDAKIPMHGMPFITKGKSRFSFWCVPASGGYSAGWPIGSIMAGFYMRCIEEHGEGDAGSWLGNILMAFVERMHEAGFSSDEFANLKSPELNALKGQILGFAKELEYVLGRSLNEKKSSTINFDAEKMLAKANSGLDLDEAAYNEYLIARMRADRAIDIANEKKDAVKGIDVMS